MKKTILLLAAAVVLIAVGLILRQNTSVFAKAAQVCLECVGIG